MVKFLKLHQCLRKHDTGRKLALCTMVLYWGHIFMLNFAAWVFVNYGISCGTLLHLSILNLIVFVFLRFQWCMLYETPFHLPNLPNIARAIKVLPIVLSSKGEMLVPRIA